ncbi:fibropellin-3-like [Actinia tenebrosa]|uniref:Fibropellin-3-like n=1 Tax=Actinia tenebrosa TaxID=6105 RepID=A0A6P8HD45_ACTTE|nr:fibropellin-3-like [Actinia tenebrosa]
MSYGGMCTDQVNGYSCTCAAGYNGTRCENDIDECASNPCVNNGTCTDLVNDYLCACVPGNGGKNCATDIDECASNPCLNGGMCKRMKPMITHANVYPLTMGSSACIVVIIKNK